MKLKKVLYLSFYFEPDLCACSFRNTPLLKELANQLKDKATIDVLTTLPNRYSSFSTEAPEYEAFENYELHRIAIPFHESGMKDQIFSFRAYYNFALKFSKDKKYDLVFASSSRLFTAYLGYKIAKKQKIPLYLDIRDIFTDTMKDVLQSKIVKIVALPALNIIEKNIFNYASHINLISGGFENYFKKYTIPNYSYFTNGLDSALFKLSESEPTKSSIKVITYAGNIGEGQGLHKIIPQAAKRLGSQYQFNIIGDGGSKQKLVQEINNLGIDNVEIIAPIKRHQLVEIYNKSDFLFLHLNDYKAFEKVLPSKIFELAAFDKPIIAGVAGFSHQFISENISNVLLFSPGNVIEFVEMLHNYKYKNEYRTSFVEKFKREAINENMAASIINYL